MDRPRWGMSPAEWAHARSELEALLTDAATTRTTVTYGEAARRAFDGRFPARSGALMDLLDDIDSAWAEERGIMIATLVVRKDTGRPGDGYFVFVEQGMGIPITDREEYWLAQAERVWAAFGADGASS